MQGDVESTGNDRGLGESFMRSVASLAEGELTFRAPFDLASSSALGANIDPGDLAGKLFDATASRDVQYEVIIRQLAPEGSEPDHREVINTVVPSTSLLFALLEGLMDELEARITE